MKRILNLNDFSGKAFGFILIIGLALPAGLFLLHWALSRVGLNLPLLQQLIWFLLAVGGALLLLFLLLVLVELIQDEALYRKYLRERTTQVGNECPFCGNRQLRSFEYTCPICGEKLR